MQARGIGRLAAVAVVALTAVPAQAAPKLDAHASPLKDVSVQSKIVSRDMDALKKISAEFAQSYRFASSQVYYKEPNKFRVDSKAGLVNVRYVINGDAKVLKAGVINKRWDISNDPGKRQTALTVGLVTPAWIDMLNVTYKGSEDVRGEKAEVFEARYKSEPKGSYFKLFMHPTQNYVMRSEQFHGDGRLKVIMQYLEPKRFSGVWVPTKAKVYNPQGQLGAVTELVDVKVNSGIPDSQFAL